MSLTPKGRGADRSFELVRQSLLQGDDLPFHEALTVGQMRQAFDAEGSRSASPRARTRAARMTAPRARARPATTGSSTRWA